MIFHIGIGISIGEFLFLLIGIGISEFVFFILVSVSVSAYVKMSISVRYRYRLNENIHIGLSLLIEDISHILKSWSHQSFLDEWRIDRNFGLCGQNYFLICQSLYRFNTSKQMFLQQTREELLAWRQCEKSGNAWSVFMETPSWTLSQLNLP